MGSETRKKGITAALLSAVLLGVVPIFGKLAFSDGFSPMAVITIRTTIAALLMLVLMIVTMRPYLYIYPVGLIGCLLAGFINGLGSILYYTALSRLDASIAHILYSFYPLFVAFWLWIDRQTITRVTIIRLTMILPAIFLLILPGQNGVDLLGALMMLGSAVLYALHVHINQRILYEAPAQTVTLYTLLAMALTVDGAALISGISLPAPLSAPLPTIATIAVYWPVLAMGLITFASRLMLFMGIKHLGGLQTAMLGLAELFVTVILAQIWLGESLSLTQWIGAVVLIISLMLIGLDSSPQKRSASRWLAWLNPPPKIPNDVPWTPH